MNNGFGLVVAAMAQAAEAARWGLLVTMVGSMGAISSMHPGERRTTAIGARRIDGLE